MASSLLPISGRSLVGMLRKLKAKPSRTYARWAVPRKKTLRVVTLINEKAEAVKHLVWSSLIDVKKCMADRRPFQCLTVTDLEPSVQRCTTWGISLRQQGTRRRLHSFTWDPRIVFPPRFLHVQPPRHEPSRDAKWEMGPRSSNARRLANPSL